jgi:hypothetical protein
MCPRTLQVLNQAAPRTAWAVGKIALYACAGIFGGMEIADYPVTVRRSTAEIWNA